MPVEVDIRRISTGEARTYQYGGKWDGDFIWSEGNYACDCNRALFFRRAAGEDETDDGAPCSMTEYLVRVRDGELVLYQDEDWQEG